MKKILFLCFLMTISLGYAQPSASPSDPPTRNAWDVFSMYSNSYSSQSGVQFLNFGGSTINADYTPAGGNACKYYTGHSYSGIQVNTAGSLDISAMTHLHFDVWSPNFNSMRIKLESSTGTARELDVTGTTVPSSSTRSQWISVDLVLSTYDLGNILTSLKYIVPVTYGQNATLYVDNVYFYRPATTSQPPTFGTFTVPAKLVGDSNFTITAPSSNSNGAFTYSSSNTAVATIVSGNQIHIVGAGSSIITASQAAAGSLVAGSTTATLNVTYPALTTDAPAPPTRNAWDVISLYSSAYTDLDGTNWRPDWGQDTSLTNYTPNVNETKQYQNLNYEGVQLAGNTNISAMTTMHVDIYSPDATALDFRIISGGEFNKTLTIVPGQWNSFDIPLSQYSGANLTVLNQLKFQTNPFGSLRNTVYLDNVYFYRAATALPSPTITGFSVPAKSVGSSSFALTNPTSNSGGAFSYTSSNTSVATISGSNVNVIGIGSATITATQAETASYSSGVITAVFDVTPDAAPTPTVDSSHVISLYSDAYTNVTNIDWNPNWGPTSTQISDISIDGNTTRKYGTMDFRGVQFESPIDASSMVSLHLDVWTSNCTSFDVYLVNQPAPEQKVTLTPTLSGWNSFDILLSQYTNINKANIGQMKFVATPSGTSTVFVDNIYFSDVPMTVAPIISAFTVASKAVGVAPFALNAPTSSSNGAFTYTSSNTDVATIDGATVTVVGIGTTTITASQAASGSYTSGSITANFVVTAPLPTAPTTGPNTPPGRNSWDVLSQYGTRYTAQAGVVFSDFGGSTIVGDVTLSDNKVVKKYTGHSYSGISTNGAFSLNVSGMTKLHMDVWSPDFVSFKIKLEAANGSNLELEVPFTKTQGSWNSYDLDLSTYTGVDLTNLKWIVPVTFGPNNTTLFISNVYFWRPATTRPPTFGAFTVPAKLIGAANFAITPPTSNSAGAITYTSSNTAVATIVSGNQIQIVGVGTSTITATQAASGSYASGFTSAALSVSYPNPSTAATSPFKNASRVISIFSDEFTNVAGTSFFQQWGSITNGSNINVASNSVQKYTNFSYVGTQLASPINVSAMQMLHLDIWTPDCSEFKVYLIGNGENAVTLNPTLSGWNSFDIDLSLYSAAGRNLSAIEQFKFERGGTGTRTVFLDNIYFYTNATKVQASQAGSTLSALNTDIMADYVLGVTDYRFKVVSNGVTEIIDRGNRRFFNLTALTTISEAYNTSYTISVATKYNNVWGTYGAESIVTTPLVPVTKVRATQCGATLAALNTDILADWLQFATEYRFKVVNGATQQVIERGSSRFFNLTSLTAGAAFNTAYTISVAVKHDGVWGDYGTECVVTTPAAPQSKVQASQCGVTLAALNTDILANWLQFATEYRFKVWNETTEALQVIENGGRRLFRLTDLTGGATAGVNYYVSVAVKQDGVWGEYGDVCVVRTPGGTSNSRQITENTDFSLVAYPNPSNSAFKLQVNGSNNETISVLVFDMMGRQIENKVVNASNVENITVGQNYSTGVYNVIVSQGMNTKTVRLVKN